jgi:hypothetical protein
VFLAVATHQVVGDSRLRRSEKSEQAAGKASLLTGFVFTSPPKANTSRASL